MKRTFFVSLFIFLGLVFFAVRVSAQHFISIQADNKQPFAIKINGIAFNSSKTGAARISNLSDGSYNLVISFAGKKYPAQNFTIAIDKSDASYTLKNQPQQGWILKNVKSTEVIASSTPQTPAGKPAAGIVAQPPPKASAFAQMLAQVIDDPDLLKTTPWVLTTKVGDAAGAGAGITAAVAEEQAADTVAYVPDTKGIIKAVEHTVKEGTELVFVDFNASGGDTIHIVIPSTGDNNDEDTTAAAQVKPAGNNPVANTGTSTTHAALIPPVVKDTEAVAKVDTDTTAINTMAPEKEEQAPAFDTSSTKQMGNPFYKPGAAVKNNADNTVSKAEKITPVQNTDEDKPVTKPVTKTAATVRQDCKKMLSENDAEKLKHKIYLETDEDKIMSLTEKALSGKCINTAQVKEMASLFLSDAGRYKFFRTVYPYVYDYGNFGTLENFMIDRKYKSMFEDLLK